MKRIQILVILTILTGCASVERHYLISPCMNSVQMNKDEICISGKHFDPAYRKIKHEFLLSFESSDSTQYFVNITGGTLNFQNNSKWLIRTGDIESFELDSLNFSEMKKLGLKLPIKSKNDSGYYSYSKKDEIVMLMQYLSSNKFEKFGIGVGINSIGKGYYSFDNGEKLTKSLCFTILNSESENNKCPRFDLGRHVTYYSK